MNLVHEIRLTLLVLKSAQLDKLLEFYKALGIELTQERHGKGPLHFSALLGDTLLELYPLPDTSTATVDSTRLGFRIASVDEVVQSLAQCGSIVVSPPQQTPGVYRAVVKDPDGRAVELYQG